MWERAGRTWEGRRRDRRQSERLARMNGSERRGSKRDKLNCIVGDENVGRSVGDMNSSCRTHRIEGNSLAAKDGERGGVGVVRGKGCAVRGPGQNSKVND